MEELTSFTNNFSGSELSIFSFIMQIGLITLLVVAFLVLIYDKFVQRDNQLLINYPLIGRMRYFLYLLRDPMRQYFGDEKFYESFDKVKWVYNAAEGKNVYASFSPGQPQKEARISIKNANCVLNNEDVSQDYSIMFGKNSVKYPFKTNSVIGRSAMSDGAISAEGTRAFAKGSYLGGFPINTGEGSLTSNFLYTHEFSWENKEYLDIVEGSFFAKGVYKIIKLLTNQKIARNIYIHMILQTNDAESYLFCHKHTLLYRINWQAPLEKFPKQIPQDIPDIIFQMGSGLYGVRDEKGEFCETRYQKTMKFAKMTEIKMAQGAKQTGGKLLKDKVNETIAYFRGVKPYENLFSPNKFPHGKTLEELFDFIGKLKELSQKPVGVKIVISTKDSFEEYAKLIKKRIEEESNAYPDFISIDGADGGSGAAPLEMMMTVGMIIHKALYVANKVLVEYGIRDEVKIIASEKVLTPDDAVVLLGLGADYVAIARAFMMSAGCIRARECSGAHGRNCPVGLATQNKRKRDSFLVEKKAFNISRYHNQMLSGITSLLAIMGIEHISKLNSKHLMFKNHKGVTHFDIKEYFEKSLV